MDAVEKGRFKKFLVWCQCFDENNQNSWNGMDPFSAPMQQVFYLFLV
jgi:hypothetical protein